MWMGKCNAQIIHAPSQNLYSAHFITLQVSYYRTLKRVSFLTYSSKTLKIMEELVSMERKKLLGKQSYVSESETSNLSAGELCFCSFVFTKLSPLIYLFVCLFFTKKTSNQENKARWW